MRILVWGLGHVGSVCAAGFAALGHEVAGIDPDAAKIHALLDGEPRLHEEGLHTLAAEALASGRLSLFERGDHLVPGFEVSLVCVGTTGPDGRHSVENLLDVAAVLGGALASSRPAHVVAIRSTVEVGFTRNVLLPALEHHAGRRAGVDFSVAVVPEFLREGNAVEDFRNPPSVVLGAWDPLAVDALERVFSVLEAPILVVTPEEAELLKLANNAYHALKVGFANEIGRVAELCGLPSDRVLELVASNQRGAASNAYLRPGFAFGGSCLPKDLRSLLAFAETLGADVPILRGVLPSNELHLDAFCRRVRAMDVRRVGVAGLAFKPGTGDLRESPALLLVHRLREGGLDVLVHDPEIDPGALTGANRTFATRFVPDLEHIFRKNAEAFVRDVEAVIVTHRAATLDPVLRACESARRPIVTPWVMTSLPEVAAGSRARPL